VPSGGDDADLPAGRHVLGACCTYPDLKPILGLVPPLSDVVSQIVLAKLHPRFGDASVDPLPHKESEHSGTTMADSWLSQANTALHCRICGIAEQPGLLIYVQQAPRPRRLSCFISTASQKPDGYGKLQIELE